MGLRKAATKVDKSAGMTDAKMVANVAVSLVEKMAALKAYLKAE